MVMNLTKETSKEYRELIASYNYWYRKSDSRIEKIREMVREKLSELPIQTRGHWETLIDDPNY